MEFIVLTEENIGSEHICCDISNDKSPSVIEKKRWLGERIEEGLVFLKADARGKCFIEYLPAESAWVPVDAPGYLFVNCLWVSGSLKGHGYADDLIDRCIDQGKADGRKGICMISSKKKRPFLSDPGYLAHKGFKVADTAQPYFELMYLSFEEDSPTPRFLDCAKVPKTSEKGLVLYHSPQCPFSIKYVPILAEVARTKGVTMKVIDLESREDARKVPCAVTSYALFCDGKFLTHEIYSEKKFSALCDDYLNDHC